MSETTLYARRSKDRKRLVEVKTEGYNGIGYDESGDATVTITIKMPLTEALTERVISGTAPLRYAQLHGERILASDESEAPAPYAPVDLAETVPA